MALGIEKMMIWENVPSRSRNRESLIGRNDNRAEALLLIENYRAHMSKLPAISAFLNTANYRINISKHY